MSRFLSMKKCIILLNYQKNNKTIFHEKNPLKNLCSVCKKRTKKLHLPRGWCSTIGSGAYLPILVLYIYLPRGWCSTAGAGAYHPIIVYIPTQSSWWSTVGGGAYHPIVVLYVQYIQNTYPEVDVLLLEQELIIQ